MTVRGLPAGRAGRTWLIRRLATAERGADVLRRKLLILRHEQQRLSLLVDRTERAWQERHASAQEWLLRGVLMGGQHAWRMALPAAAAQVTVSWRTEMGVRYPDAAQCTLPMRSAWETAPSNAALALAERAFREALEAAVQQAVVQAAIRQLDAEAQLTSTRLRALTDRVVPRLSTDLHLLELELEQFEHEDAVRRRWAAERTGSAR